MASNTTGRSALKNNIAIGLALICLAAMAAAYFFFSGKQVKIGYVNSGELVNDYIGMREARNTYQNKAQIWQGNIDTLKLDFQRAVNSYNNEFAKLSDQEKKSREAILKQQQDNLIQYKQAIEDQAKKEDERITSGVLNQINGFVEQYGKDHGYDVILGTTLSGSLLYAKDDINLTKIVLEELNKSYDPLLMKKLSEQHDTIK